MNDDILKSNMDLEVAFRPLQVQMDKTNQKLDLCLQIIQEFSHFVPSVVDGLQEELDKIDELC